MTRACIHVLIRKEWTLFVARSSYKLYCGILAFVFVLGTVGGVLHYRAEKAADIEWRQKQIEGINSLKYRYSITGPGYTCRIPPAPLAALAGGADPLITAPFITRIWAKQVIGFIDTRGPIARFIARVDISTLLMLFLSVFSVYLCQSIILNELRSRTIYTLLVFGVPVNSIVMAKLLVAVAAIALPLVVLYGIAVTVVSLCVPAFSAVHFGRAALMLAVFVLQVVFWVALSFIIQGFVRSRRESLAVGFLAWALMVFVLPQLVRVVQEHRAPLLNTATYFAAARESMEEQQRSYQAFRADKKPFLKATEPIGTAVGTMTRLLNDGVLDEAYFRLERYYSRLTQEFSFADISPTYAANLVVTELANTGVGDYLFFREQMVGYQREWIETGFLGAGSDGSLDMDGIRHLLSCDLKRLSFAATWQRISRPLIVLLLHASVLCFLLVLVLPRKLQRAIEAGL